MKCGYCNAELERRMACPTCGAPPGLGDYVHAGLSAVGITPERVAAVMGVGDCGCEGRRQWLNEAGRAIGIGTPPEDAKNPG